MAWWFSISKPWMSGVQEKNHLNWYSVMQMSSKSKRTILLPSEEVKRRRNTERCWRKLKRKTRLSNSLLTSITPNLIPLTKSWKTHRVTWRNMPICLHVLMRVRLTHLHKGLSNCLTKDCWKNPSKCLNKVTILKSSMMPWRLRRKEKTCVKRLTLP